ncbi:hypothetical protein E1263_32540 [Kribbella antibiotica]|uniref:Glycoside hydrolase family 42 N-terminal domain-containing protein n=1 Tax=Kribbella antibiotica TaxID=190195 RepID=A0A4V2YM35_9ACTN|nr:hypothetical protein [Kribbella antibiotica]TDD49077.1 hypothetical protein E1263_32540 [Kribbella antibiotica]
MTDDSSATAPHTINRRGILKLAAAAGILPFLPATTALAKTTEAAVAACSPVPLLSGPEFPIGSFWPPSMQERFNTLERFQELKNAGFTFSFVGASDEDDTAYVHSTLSYADQVGLKALVVNGPERALQTYRDYARHPSFVGYRLADEPGPLAFPALATATAAFQREAPHLMPYLNMYPGDGEGWRRYVHGFTEKLRPVVLSYDRYPLLSGGLEDGGYFAAWQEMRAVGLGTGRPTWIYIQSLAYNNHRKPTPPELAWQVNISLAYGCKGVQYFCYQTPRSSGGEVFGPALLDFDGNRTDLYDASKDLNTKWLSPVGAQLKPLVSEHVVHANEPSPPAGAAAFTPDTFLRSTSGDAVVLGRFRSTDRTSKTRWLLIANRSHGTVAQAVVNVNTDTVKAISQFDPFTGTYAQQGYPEFMTVRLPAGAAALFRLDAPGAFVDPQVQLVLVASGAAHHTIQETGGNWLGPNPLGSTARLVGIAEYNGALHVMELAGDTIYHRVRTVDGAWGSRNEFSRIAGISSLATSVVIGSLQAVFAVNGIIFHTMQHPDGTWDGPNRLGDAAQLVAATDIHDVLNVISVAGSQIYHRVRFGDGTWGSRNLFTTLNGITSIDVTHVAGEMMIVIAAGGQLYYAVQHTDGSWQWPTQTGDAADQVTASAVGGELQITAVAAGQPFIRRRRADGTLTPRAVLPPLTGVTALSSTSRSPESCP